MFGADDLAHPAVNIPATTSRARSTRWAGSPASSAAPCTTISKARREHAPTELRAALLASWAGAGSWAFQGPATPCTAPTRKTHTSGAAREGAGQPARSNTGRRHDENPGDVDPFHPGAPAYETVPDNVTSRPTTTMRPGGGGRGPGGEGPHAETPPCAWPDPREAVCLRAHPQESRLHPFHRRATNHAGRGKIIMAERIF